LKAKQDWQFIGRFIATVVQLTTIISGVFKKTEVGLEILEWFVGSGKDYFVALLTDTVEKYRKQSLSSKTKVESDPIIRVDRSIRPSYPDWMKEVMHPELECMGPSEYDLSKVQQWLHDGQGDSKWIKGKVIYDHLKGNDILKICLTLRDLEEIHEKGITFFRKHFKGKAVFAWASLVRDRGGGLFVPYLYVGGGKVVLGWHCLDYGFLSNNPALRFANLSISPQHLWGVLFSNTNTLSM
jgi:hypothetical protein